MSPSCLITFEKIETFICQSQKQTFAFKLENLCLSDIFRSKVPGSQLPDSRVSGSQGPGSQGPRVLDLRVLWSRISSPDFRLCSLL